MQHVQPPLCLLTTCYLTSSLVTWQIKILVLNTSKTCTFLKQIWLSTQFENVICSPRPVHGGSNLLWNQCFCFFFFKKKNLFTYYFLDSENLILFPDPNRCSLLFHNIFQTSNSKRPFKISKLRQTFKTLLEPCRPNRCTEYTTVSISFCASFSHRMHGMALNLQTHIIHKLPQAWDLFAIKFASFVKTV